MNWGKGIAIALALFIGFILYLVINLVSHSVELESADYYQKEMEFGNEIESESNANALEKSPEISLTESHIVVQLDPIHKYDEVLLTLKRPNSSDLDKSFPITGTNTFTLDKTTLEKGVYSLVLIYTINEKKYLQRKEIYI